MCKIFYVWNKRQIKIEHRITHCWWIHHLQDFFSTFTFTFAPAPTRLHSITTTSNVAFSLYCACVWAQSNKIKRMTPVYNLLLLYDVECKKNFRHKKKYRVTRIYFVSTLGQKRWLRIYMSHVMHVLCMHCMWMLVLYAVRTFVYAERAESERDQRDINDFCSMFNNTLDVIYAHELFVHNWLKERESRIACQIHCCLILKRCCELKKKSASTHTRTLTHVITSTVISWVHVFDVSQPFKSQLRFSLNILFCHFVISYAHTHILILIKIGMLFQILKGKKPLKPQTFRIDFSGFLWNCFCKLIY